MKELLPIGSLIQQEFPPDIYSTSSNDMKSRITYKVVAHVKVARFLGDIEGVLAEELKAQYIEYWDGEQWTLKE